jgi:hypothetical protein
MLKPLFIGILASCVIQIGLSQQDVQALFIKDIYDHTLQNAQCDKWLSYLSEDIGGRLSGSQNAATAVDYTYDELDKISIVDKTWKQSCMVPQWVRGDKEEVIVYHDGETHYVNALSLGNSVGTGSQAIKADIIEVFGLDTLKLLGEKEIKGKIVFFNRPMSNKHINTGYAYGEAVDQRVHGASQASKYGAVAVIVRSMTTRIDDLPHTGVQVYADGVDPIPSLAISTMDAEKISQWLDSENVTVSIKNNPQILPEVESYNVIAEITGSEYPDEIILVGGHLDSWDVGGGAHDDGAGCVHSMQVIETFNALGYRPKRTIRCVLFMNEENGLGGGKEYARVSNENGEYHLAAIESDSGGFTPRGFTCTAEADVFKPFLSKLQEFDTFLDPYDLYLKAGGAGADINPLKSQKGLLIGFKPDNQRYFDYHHTTADVFENVNVRELRLGAASIASLVYLIDQYGL